MMCGLEMNLANALGELQPFTRFARDWKTRRSRPPCRERQAALGSLMSQLAEWVERWGWQEVIGTDRKQFLRSRRDQHAKIDEQFHRVMLTFSLPHNDVPLIVMRMRLPTRLSVGD